MIHHEVRWSIKKSEFCIQLIVLSNRIKFMNILYEFTYIYRRSYDRHIMAYTPGV